VEIFVFLRIVMVCPAIVSRPSLNHAG